MKRLHIGILALAAILAGSVAMAADKPADVRDLMTANQYRNAGLDKLSADQIAALNSDVTNISVLAVANGPANLEHILTTDQFSGAGLNTLSEDQMRALNTWLTGYLHSQSQVADAAPPGSAASGTNVDHSLGASMLKTSAGEPDSVQSTIKGTFLGWSGSTIFTLDNGQVWQQSEPADYSTHMQNPVVIIKKMHFGYLLTLPGNGQTVFVMRIK